MRPNLITRLKEEWNNLDPVDPLRGLIADAIDALAEKPAQPSKPWVGLTDEERDAILDREFKQWWSRHDAVCRAIEAKLKDKNGY